MKKQAKINNNGFSFKPLLGWCLFDFTSSIPATIGGIYFSKWFIENIGAGSITFNVLFFSSTLIILLTGKYIGNRIDYLGYKGWIITAASITGGCLFILFFGSQYLSKSLMIPFAFIFFLAFLFGLQVSKICHNVYLRVIIPEFLQSKLSGYGTASNWAGSIVGILVTIPIIINYSGAHGRELTFLSAAIMYNLLIPIALYYMFKSAKNNQQTNHRKSVKVSSKLIIGKKIVFQLLIFLLLFDVMSTVQRNLPIYLSEVFKMTDDTQSIAFLVILLSAVIGGILASRVVNYVNSKYWLKICSLMLAISIFLITIKSQILLWIAFGLAGISYGVLESSIRINFMKNFSKSVAGENFGVLAVVERTAGLIGPIIWILPFYIVHTKESSYICSMTLMSLTALLAFVLLFINITSTSSNDLG